MQQPKIVVVTPIYEDKVASTRLMQDLAKEFGRDVHIVAVDDGSVKEPVHVDMIEGAGLEGVVIRLKRNVGHQRAIAIGLGYVAENMADAEAVVVMDSDGEDLPSTIRDLLRGLEEDDVDVVVATRKSRVETLRFRLFYVVYKVIFGLLTGRKISFGNFMAMKARSARRLAVMHELWTHVAAATLASKLRIRTCALDRGPRYAGRSKMNFIGLVLHGFKALMVFAEDVLVRVGLACVLISCVSILGACVAVGLKVAGYATPGWFSMALGVLFLVFLQTAALTLMSLMLSGVTKSGAVRPHEYRDFVDGILPARKAVE